MSNKKRTYIPLDIRDWPAEGGPVVLGSIIASPSTPEKPKNSTPFELPQVYVKDEPEWKDTRKTNNNGVVGIFAKVFGAISAADLSAKWGITGAESFEAEKVVKKFFVADEDYIEKRLEDEKVQKFLLTHRKRVFIITGLMIAYKPTASTAEGKNIELTAKGGFEAGGAQIGPKVNWSKGKGSDTSYKGGSDVIYAIQLASIHYKVIEAKKSVLVSTEEYNKGAWHNVGIERQEKPGKEDDMVEVVEFLNFDNDVTGEELCMETAEVVDVEGEVCDLVLLKKN